MKNNNIEYRRAAGTIERAADSRLIEGTAVVFDSPSRDLGFIEYIHRDAITQDVLDNSDIFCLLNHEPDKKLARRNKGKGSLNLELKDDGLHYSFKAKNNDLGNTVLEFVQDGELYESSFAFTISDEEGADVWTRNADGTYRRDIYKIDRLYDVSPCWEAAYPETSVSSRSFEAIQERCKVIDKILEEKLKEIEDL